MARMVAVSLGLIFLGKWMARRQRHEIEPTFVVDRENPGDRRALVSVLCDALLQIHRAKNGPAEGGTSTGQESSNEGNRVDASLLYHESD